MCTIIIDVFLSEVKKKTKEVKTAKKTLLMQVKEKKEQGLV